MAKKKLSPPEGDHCSYATTDVRVHLVLTAREKDPKSNVLDVTVKTTLAHIDRSLLADDRGTKKEGGIAILDAHHADNGLRIESTSQAIAEDLMRAITRAIIDWERERAERIAANAT